MAGLKPARVQRRLEKAYTRREYIKGVPNPKITKFSIGNTKGDFRREVSLVSESKVQIRHNALEAARVAATNYLEKKCGSMNYFLRIRVYPHHVLRENPMAVGAGADRVQDGMRRAFGKPIGTAARVKDGQKIISVYVNDDNVEYGKEALRRAMMKLPTTCRIAVEEVS